MIDLKQYLYKDVMVIDNKGETTTGNAIDMIFADENERGVDELVIETNNGSITGFSANEVSSITEA